VAPHAGGIEKAKVAAIWDLETSDLFSEVERLALRFAMAVAAIRNLPIDDDAADRQKYYTEYQIVEIVSVISMVGFLNRWNNPLATELEEKPIAFCREEPAENGWSGGKYVGGKWQGR
tara:strand:- start:154 stop:507 length:354 start_codon:yes stop_codon:yes gene_type:complete